MTQGETFLWERYLESRNIEDRNAIVEKYLWLVNLVVRRMMNSGLSSRVSEDELEAAGNYGLINAVILYTPYAGSCFKKYSYRSIRNAMLNLLREILGRVNGRDAWSRLSREFFIDEVRDNLAGSPLEEMVQAEEHQELLGCLSERERTIISLRYYRGLSMEDIGEIVDLSRPGVSRVHGEALRRMRKKMENS